MRPASDFFRRGQADANGVEISNRICQIKWARTEQGFLHFPRPFAAASGSGSHGQNQLVYPTRVAVCNRVGILTFNLADIGELIAISRFPRELFFPRCLASVVSVSSLV